MPHASLVVRKPFVCTETTPRRPSPPDTLSILFGRPQRRTQRLRRGACRGALGRPPACRVAALRGNALGGHAPGGRRRAPAAACQRARLLVALWGALVPQHAHPAGPRPGRAYEPRCM